MQLTSTAFENEQTIPHQYTCKGKNISPELSWSGAPKETQSFALVVDDPDAPSGTFTHWVTFNIPANKKYLPENDESGFPQGTNSFGETRYGGPCPPQGHGPHRYFFKIFALDTRLDALPGIKKETLMDKMKGHVLDQAELMGTYEVQ